MFTTCTKDINQQIIGHQILAELIKSWPPHPPQVTYNPTPWIVYSFFCPSFYSWRIWRDNCPPYPSRWQRPWSGNAGLRKSTRNLTQYASMYSFCSLVLPRRTVLRRFLHCVTFLGRGSIIARILVVVFCGKFVYLLFVKFFLFLNASYHFKYFRSFPEHLTTKSWNLSFHQRFLKIYNGTSVLWLV